MLAQLGIYQEDGNIHIVAPPGAGKTVLGLEIIRRINRVTLVLVPSLTIRAQWMERLAKDFMADDRDLALLAGHDLRHPHPITIVTYQALHQYLKEEQAASLNWVGLLVVDECHHLRREWWKS
ncbi:MAG: DEAD/DEAH box helicase family protein [Saprospiraceae bacterium]